METRLKSALRIPKQQLLLAIRAAIFVAALWLFADRDFGPLQLAAFVLIGAVLYFTPVFHALVVFSSFFVLMILSPIAMSVFGPQLEHPLLLAGFFGVLFYFLLGIKQVLFINRLKIYSALHLALMYCLSILFFAAPGGEWFFTRSLLLFLFAYILLREFFAMRMLPSGSRIRFLTALGAFLVIEATWAIGLLPIGFINAAGVLLIFIFTLEEALLASVDRRENRKGLLTEFITGVVLLLIVFGFSNWTLS